MPKYKIYYGLGGGFGGARNNEPQIEECKDENEANEIAYELACEEYESYDGMHGLLSIDDIMEEEGVDESEAEEMWLEQREDWIDYFVELIKE